MAFVVPLRFCGPPASGNGGWVSGHLSRLVTTTVALPAVTVRLRTPPPLERELAVQARDAVVHLLDGEQLVAQGAPAAALPGPTVPPVPFTEAQLAGSGYEGLASHPFPTCFSCGTARAARDGLRQQPGRVAGGGGEYASAWVPADDVDTETVWAALDCPGGWASGIAGRAMVLGTMTAQLWALPTPGEPHVVMAWERGHEGRKHYSATALYGADGRLVAQAEATWVAVDPATVRPSERHL
ncbi:hypothetical protein [Pedococcus sp. 5OH_020]|uniref:hypothetical protein n=1 Tax=Pedococcus sp. 5OH_020 TaxID=2989814 RepID=UPI0022E9CBB0|nr:hypothetical protein [Pedococcus sp. 5OH_020]